MSRNSNEQPKTVPAPGIEGSNVIELGIEGVTAAQTLGLFEPPIGFNRAEYDMAYGVKEAGTYGAFPSVAELEQPQRHSAIRLQHPGWKVWKDGNGQPHIVKRGSAVLMLMYCSKKDNQVINKAFGSLSQKQLQSVEEKIKRSALVLPADIRASDERVDEAMREQMLMAEQLRGG